MKILQIIVMSLFIMCSASFASSPGQLTQAQSSPVNHEQLAKSPRFKPVADTFALLDKINSEFRTKNNMTEQRLEELTMPLLNIKDPTDQQRQTINDHNLQPILNANDQLATVTMHFMSEHPNTTLNDINIATMLFLRKGHKRPSTA